MPYSSTTTWSEISITTDMSCSISRIEVPCSVWMDLRKVVELGGLARVEAGGGLVEAEQRRLGAHGARDLEAALGAVGQVAGRIVRALGEGDLVEPVLGPLDGLGLGFARSAWRRRGPAPSSPRRPSARCAAPRSGSPAPSCRRTGGCSGRCGRRGRARRSRESGMRSSRKMAPVAVLRKRWPEAVSAATSAGAVASPRLSSRRPLVGL